MTAGFLMPFTISHAAAVLPFARPLARWRLLSAAVIGSMAPDFGFFLPWRPARFETHSLDALVTFCLPIGLAVYWLFQRLIRTPILELLPPGAHARWQGSAAPADYRSLRQWLYAACGILGGAFTHLVWDAFTHEGARGLRLIPALEEPAVFVIRGYAISGPHLLQDSNSILGLIAVIAVVVYSLRPGPPGEGHAPRRLSARERHRWVAAYVATAVVVTTILFVFRHPTPPRLSLPPILPISSAAIAVLRGLGAALVGVSACFAAHLRGQTHPNTPPRDVPS
jgi:Domain of unknown function (DUF4184)